MTQLQPGRANRPKSPPGGKGVDPVNLSPVQRLTEMTQQRIDSLEGDKSRLGSRVDDLQLETVRLAGEVAGLREALAREREALKNAESNNVYASILIALGGFLVSYAAFTGNLAPAWANLSAGLLAAGVGLLLWQSLRRWMRG